MFDVSFSWWLVFRTSFDEQPIRSEIALLKEENEREERERERGKRKRKEKEERERTIALREKRNCFFFFSQDSLPPHWRFTISLR